MGFSALIDFLLQEQQELQLMELLLISNLIWNYKLLLYYYIIKNYYHY